VQVFKGIFKGGSIKMRYIIETKDEEGLIGIQISKWQKEKKLDIIEKAEPVIEIKAQLEKVARALDIMKGSGYNSEVMKIYLNKKTGVSMAKVEALLNSQEDFFKAIGVK
jgi:uncharacterized protein YxjI